MNSLRPEMAWSPGAPIHVALAMHDWRNITEWAQREAAGDAVDIGEALRFVGTESIHTMLGSVGMIPFYGIPADLANAALYYGEGNFEEAMWAGIGTVPLVGDAAAAAHYAGVGFGTAAGEYEAGNYRGAAVSAGFGMLAAAGAGVNTAAMARELGGGRVKPG